MKTSRKFQVLGLAIVATLLSCGVEQQQLRVADGLASTIEPKRRGLLALSDSKLTIKKVTPGQEEAPLLTNPANAKANPHPELNVASNANLRGGHDLPERFPNGRPEGLNFRRNGHGPDGNPLPVGSGNSNNMGASIKYIVPTGNNISVRARQQIHTGMEFGNVNRKTVLYAPTLMMPNYCPLEAVTTYRRDQFWFSTERVFAVYNHDNNSWPTYEYMNQSWLNDFARTYSDNNAYYQVLVQKQTPPGTGWSVYLWNYTTNAWVSKAYYSWSHPYNFDVGWNNHENYILQSQNIYLPTIRSRELKVWRGQGSTEALATSTYAMQGGVNYDQSYMKYYLFTNFTFPNNFYEWNCTLP